MKKLLLPFTIMALLFSSTVAFGYGEGEDAVEVPAEAVEEEAPAVEPEPVVEPVAGTRAGTRA